MKKSFFYAGILAAGLMTVSTSCSKDEEIINGGNEVVEAAAQEIVLNVSSAGDGLTTKAGRPLSSADAGQQIDKVKIVIVNSSNEIQVVKDINDWMNVSKDYTTNGHGKQYTWKLSKDETLGKDTYRVYAIGYTDPTTSFYDDQLSTFDGLSKGGTLSNGFVKLGINGISDTKLGEEIFAGEIASISVNDDGEFEIPNGTENILTLHRQVTGTLGYYKNIPTFPVGQKTDVLAATDGYADYLNGLKLRLVVSNRFEDLTLSGFNTTFTTTGENVWYVVNGEKGSVVDGNIDFNYSSDLTSSSAKGYLAYEINLSDWFVGGDVNKDGYLGIEDADGDNWRTPVGSDNKVDYQRGTVFAGQFLVPFTKVPNVNTMELQLVAGTALNANSGEGGSSIVTAGSVIRTWKINLPQNDPQVIDPEDKGNRHIFVLKNGLPVEWTGVENEEQYNSYSLLRNHLYTVGKISEDDNEPEDLSKGQNLILQVNDNWEMIHQMEVE